MVYDSTQYHPMVRYFKSTQDLTSLSIDASTSTMYIIRSKHTKLLWKLEHMNFVCLSHHWRTFRSLNHRHSCQYASKNIHIHRYICRECIDEYSIGNDACGYCISVTNSCTHAHTHTQMGGERRFYMLGQVYGAMIWSFSNHTWRHTNQPYTIHFHTYTYTNTILFTLMMTIFHSLSLPLPLSLCVCFATISCQTKRNTEFVSHASICFYGIINENQKVCHARAWEYIPYRRNIRERLGLPFIYIERKKSKTASYLYMTHTHRLHC